jgi:hypothetical protein
MTASVWQTVLINVDGSPIPRALASGICRRDESVSAQGAVSRLAYREGCHKISRDTSATSRIMRASSLCTVTLSNFDHCIQGREYSEFAGSVNLPFT